jgi:hypothetical protein
MMKDEEKQLKGGDFRVSGTDSERVICFDR